MIESEKKLEQITEIRAKMKEVSSESRNKDELYKQLVSLIFMIQLDFKLEGIEAKADMYILGVLRKTIKTFL